MSLNKQQRAELEQLASEHDTLKAEHVVEFARNPETALHQKFEWDNDAAADKFRLAQARQLIRVHVVKLPGIPRSVRALISLPTDRENGGGYRDTRKVVSNPMQTNQLIEMALTEIESAAKRFQFIPALHPVYSELHQLVAKHRLAMMQQSASA